MTPERGTGPDDSMKRTAETMPSRTDFLVETDWLDAHLNDPNVRVVDIRGSVPPVPAENDKDDKDAGLGYESSFDEYAAEHIPGALYLDWTRDIVDLDDPVAVQVARQKQFAETMRHAGIGDQDLVVAYDTHPASTFATRLWWALRYYGHAKVVVLNGGLNKWKREGRPVQQGPVTYPEADFTAHRHPGMRSTVDDVIEVLDRRNAVLVDARDPGQYTGTVVRPGNRSGHIPGAINIPREDLVDLTTGTWRPTEELSRIFAAADLAQDTPVVTYCNGGVAAASVMFGLAMAGHPQVSNYDGSWNEWSAREDLPVETGDAVSEPEKEKSVITEMALLTALPGQGDALGRAIDQGAAHIRSAVGCESVAVTRCVETPDRFVVTVKWSSLEAHVEDFRGSEAFKQWIGSIKGLFDPATLDAQHYSPYPA